MTNDPRGPQSKSGRPAPSPAGAQRVPAPPSGAQRLPAPPRPGAPGAGPPVAGASATHGRPVPADFEFYDEDPSPTIGERIRSLSPALVILTVGSIGSLIFTLIAVTSHTTPVAVLLSAGVVTFLIFAVDCVVTSVAMWRASQYGETLRALLLALMAGVASIVSLGALAGVLVMVLILNS